MSLVRGGARVLRAPAAGWVGLFFALPLATVIVDEILAGCELPPRAGLRSTTLVLHERNSASNAKIRGDRPPMILPLPGVPLQNFS